jgi:uncharacterized protein
MKFILIHGYKSGPKLNFWPWLIDELKKRGHEVVAPQLPDAENPDEQAWTEALLEEVKNVDDETIVIGHSLGGAMALRFLEAVEARSTPKACLLISTPWMIQSDKFRGFFMSELDFEVLMWKVSRFALLHSKDDDVIPFDHAQKYEKVLHAKLHETEEAGHFKGESYPVMLKVIDELVNEELIYEPGMSLENDFENVH